MLVACTAGRNASCVVGVIRLVHAEALSGAYGVPVFNTVSALIANVHATNICYMAVYINAANYMYRIQQHTHTRGFNLNIPFGLF